MAMVVKAQIQFFQALQVQVAVMGLVIRLLVRLAVLAVQAAVAALMLQVVQVVRLVLQHKAMLEVTQLITLEAAVAAVVVSELTVIQVQA